MTRSIEIRLNPILTVVLMVVTVLWVTCGQRSAVQLDRLERDRRALRANVDSLEAREVVRERERAVAEATIAAQAARITELAQQDAAERRQLDSLTPRLAAVVPDTVRPLLALVIAGYERRLLIKDSIIGALAMDTLLLRQQLVVADSAAARFHRAMHEAIEESDAWRRRARRNLLEQLRDALPWMGATYLLAKLTGP